MYTVDSRPARGAAYAFTIRRRRCCIGCGHRITTREDPAVAPPDPRDTSRWPS
jgi:transcriptional regulator NrdR family protein